MSKQKVLLHICCGVCAFACVESLRQKGFDVTGFFFNPNIHPQSEYQIRWEALGQVAEHAGLKVISGQYLADEWFSRCEKYKDQPEGKQRCLVCFRLRLEQTFQECLNRGFDFFTTTLTVSPHKNSKVILELGETISREKFLAFDFKKEKGFEKTIAFAKSQNIYRQRYCGCVYSQPK